MSDGTEFTADIFLNRQTYAGKAQVKEAIEMCDVTINTLERRISMMVIANIKEITPTDAEPLQWADLTLSETFSELYEETIKRYQLGLYLENNDL